jgi:hypothetical protein
MLVLATLPVFRPALLMGDGDDFYSRREPVDERVGYWLAKTNRRQP